MNRAVPIWAVGLVAALGGAVAVLLVLLTAPAAPLPAASVAAGDTPTAAAPSAVQPAAPVSATVSSDGATLRNAVGVEVVVPAGVLPQGATVQIGPAPTPLLPEGVVSVGQFYKIQTSAELTGLATLRLPIPAGADAGDLAVYQVRPDGGLAIYGGQAQAGAFVTTLTEFSDEGLGAGPHMEVVLRSSARIRAPVASGLDASVRVETGAVTEFTVTAEGGSGRYDFDFSYTTQDVASASTETVGRGGDEQTLYLVYDKLRPVPDILKVTVIDRGADPPRRGIVYLYVDVVAPALDIVQFDIPSGAGFNSESGRLTAGFRVCVIGGENPPYHLNINLPDGTTLTSNLSTGNGRPALEPLCETLSGEFPFEPGLPITAVASVMDAAGLGPASRSLFLQTPLLLDVEIRGPAEVTVRDATAFTAVVTGGKPAYGYSWYVKPPDGDLALVASDVTDLQHAFAKPGIYTVSVFVRDETRAEVSADFAVEVVGSMTVSIVTSAGAAPVTAGQPVTLTAEVTGAADDARLRYLWGLPDGDVDSEEPTVVTTPAQAGIVAVGVTVFDEQNDEEAETILDLDVHEPLRLAFASIPDAIDEGEPAAIGLSLGGGGAGPDGGELTYELAVDYGDGSTEDLAVTDPDTQIEHTYMESGSYTVTVVASAPDGQTVTEAVELGVGGPFTVVMERRLPEGFVVLANEVVIAVEGRAARVTAFGYQTEWAGYEGFTLDSSGNTQTFTVDCVNHTTIEHQGDDLAYDPATGAITGTINLLWTRLDVGSVCPFGGIDDVQTRTAVVDIKVVDGQGSGQFLSEEALPRFFFGLEPKAS